jgi:erythromycin esterase
MFPRSHALVLALLPAFLSASHAQPVPADATANRDAWVAYFQEHARPFGTIDDLAPLLDFLGERRFSLLGESTHGTHEYYRWRDEISRRLITRHGFRFVALEGDWQAVQRLNDYVKHRTPQETDARAVMAELTRWPKWLWANEEFAAFVEWLRLHNAGLPEEDRVGLYGLDMQDPDDSMRLVLEWFGRHDPDNLPRVKSVYDQVGGLPDGFADYARGLMRGGRALSAEFAQPVELLRAHAGKDEAWWNAKQNALAVKRAEARYRAMIAPGPDSWNLRAAFMHEALLRVTERYGEESRGIVWAHNTHVGDADATDMGQQNLTNIGRLLRESEGRDEVGIAGFATYRGGLIAGQTWGGPVRRMTMPPARAGSLDALLHEAAPARAFMLFAEEAGDAAPGGSLAQRAAGVIYNPAQEAYVSSLPVERYDALLFFAETRPLTPLAPL